MTTLLRFVRSKPDHNPIGRLFALYDSTNLHIYTGNMMDGLNFFLRDFFELLAVLLWQMDKQNWWGALDYLFVAIIIDHRIFKSLNYMK